MTEAPITPLRRRMIEDMTMRKFSPRTQEGYIRAVKGFSAFLGASPDTASFEDLRRYQLHLVSSGTGAPTINHTTTALRFLFMVTLRRPELVAYLPFVREPRRQPVVLSPEEVARLLNAAPGLKYKAALSIAYGAGLRASEIISLKVADIDSARMLIRVAQGKGRKDRYVMLSQHLLDLLRAWWKVGRPSSCRCSIRHQSGACFGPRLVPLRQRELKGGAAGHVRRSPQAPAMGLDDRTGDR